MAADREGADGHGWYAPELLRIKGEVLLQQAADQSTLAAEDCFLPGGPIGPRAGRSILGAAGRPQRCPFEGEPRSTPRGESTACIVYDRFTEGFATADLQAARTMLEGLPS